ncbi:bacteriocin [Staphylococcus hominis]|nr:bacteriocin [Staphylococcus hominis]UJB22129.1 bacteriocin [Staphylococcus hominis]
MKTLNEKELKEINGGNAWDSIKKFGNGFKCGWSNPGRCDGASSEANDN